MSRGLKRLTGCFVQSIGPSVIAMRGEVMSLEFISCAAWLIISGFGVRAFDFRLLALGFRPALAASTNQARHLRSRARSRTQSFKARTVGAKLATEPGGPRGLLQRTS